MVKDKGSWWKRLNSPKAALYLDSVVLRNNLVAQTSDLFPFNGSLLLGMVTLYRRPSSTWHASGCANRVL